MIGREDTATESGAPSPAPPDPARGALDYADGRRRPRRRVVTVAATLLLVALAAWAAWRWAPDAWARAYLLWLQSDCLDYEFPPDAVVIERRPPSQGGSTDRASGFVLTTGSGVTLWLRNPPQCWVKLSARLGGGPGSLRANSPSAFRAVLLVHRMRPPGGSDILLVVGGPAQLPDGRVVGNVLRCNIVVPGTRDKLPSVRGGGSVPILNAGEKLLSEGPGVLKLYAGRVDPANPARFTMPYELDGERGTIEGVLSEKRGLQLRVKDGPARVYDHDAQPELRGLFDTPHTPQLP